MSEAAITTGAFGGTPFGPDVIGRITSAIVGGAPLASVYTLLSTGRASVGFPVLTDSDDPEWVGELQAIPTLGLDTEPYVIAVAKLGGIVPLSNESVEDPAFPLEAQLEDVLHQTFSAKLDRDLFSGEGPAPTPQGLLGVAEEATGADLELAAISAKASIANSGGVATHIAVNPDTLATLEGARDSTGRRLYPDVGVSFAGLETVVAPAATTPVVVDRTRIFLIVRNDFKATLNPWSDTAYTHDATLLRLLGRFALAVPQPAPAVRKLAVEVGS